MTSQVLNRWIVQAFVIDLLVCAVAYALQRVNPIFTWVFIASLIILLWLAVAGICSFIEVVAEREIEGSSRSQRQNPDFLDGRIRNPEI